MKNEIKIETDKYGKYYYQNEQLHREDGPAVERIDGYKVWYKVWYKNGKLHREDGPAIEWFDGYKSYYYNGKHIFCSSTEEFKRLIKLKMFW